MLKTVKEILDRLMESMKYPCQKPSKIPNGAGGITLRACVSDPDRTDKCPVCVMARAVAGAYVDICALFPNDISKQESE